MDEELEELRERLGLRANQKAELLRELAALAGWIVRRAERGSVILARRGDETEELRSPVIERLRSVAEPPPTRVALGDAEVELLAAVLDRGFSPTPGLRKALSRLADAKRKPPKLRWKRTTG